MINRYFDYKNKTQKVIDQINFLSEICTQIEGRTQYRLYLNGEIIKIATKQELLERCVVHYASKELPYQVIAWYIRCFLMTVKAEKYYPVEDKLIKCPGGYILNTFQINPLYEFFEDTSIDFFKGQRRGRSVNSRTSTIHIWKLYKNSKYFNMDYEEFHSYVKDADKYIQLEPESAHYQFTGHMRHLHLTGNKPGESTYTSLFV